MKKYSIVTLLLSLCFSFSVASAQVADEVVNQIDCANITRPLKLGSRDSNTGGDVTTLQIYLAQANYLEVDPTGYFGRATFKAVQGFQRDHGIVTQGNVGPYTRAKIKEVSCTTQTDGTVSLPIQENPIVKRCDAIGTKSEGWYNSKTGQLIAYTNCSIIVNPLTPAPPVGTLPVTLYATASCTIPVGASKCTVTAATMGHENTKIYDLFNKTRGVNSGSAFSSGNSFTFNPSSASWDTAGHITYGDNILMVRGWGSTVDLATATVKGVCATGSTWNGSVCAAGAEISPVAVVSFNSQEPNFNINYPVNTASLSWQTTVPTNVAIDMTCSLDTFTVTTNKGGQASCGSKNGVGIWYGQTNGSILVVPIGTNVPITVTFTLTVLDQSGNYTNQKKTLSIVFPASSSPTCTTGSTWNGMAISVCEAGSTGSSTTSTTGSITLGTPNCTIAAGTSQCGATLSWNVTNPVAGKTEFIIAGGFNYTMTQDSYLPTNFMNGRGENVSTYTLKNNGVTLDTKTVTSKCAIGSSWNGTVCAAGSTTTNVLPVTLYATASCTIPVGASKCTVTAATMGHENTKIYDLFNKTRGVNSGSAFSSGNSFTFNPASASWDTAGHITYGDNILMVRGWGSTVDLATATVKGVCATGSTWNGSVCGVGSAPPIPAPTPTASFTISVFGQLNAHNVTIPVGTPNVKIWSSTNGTNYSAKYSRTGTCTNVKVSNADWSDYINPNNLVGIPNIAGTMASGNNPNGVATVGDVGCTISITYTVTNASGVQASDTINVTVTAATTTSSSTTGSITLGTPNCTIAVGTSQCGATLSWNVTNPVAGKTEFIIAGGFNYTMTQDSYLPTNFMNGRGENVSTYTLKNNGVTLDTKTVTSKCAIGSSWNGTVCAAGSTSVIPVSLFISTSCTIPVGASKCTITAATTGHEGSKFYDLFNKTRGITTANAFYSSNNFTFAPVYGDTAAHLVYGNNILAVRNSGSSVDLATANVNGMCASGSTWNGTVCAATNTSSSIPASGYEILTSDNCIINVGESTCTSTIPASVKNIASGKTYDFYNETTLVTTNNAFTPNNLYRFSLGSSSFKGTAAELKYGANILRLRGAGSSSNITNVTATASCASGSSWNGTVCAAGSTTTNVLPVTLYATASCTIPVGASKCTITAATTGHEGSKFYDLFNKTRGITTGNAFYSSNNFTFAPVYGDTAGHITYGTNILAVRNFGSSVDLSAATVNGICASGSSWNGTVCAGGSTSSASPVVTLTATPSIVAPQGRTTLTWSVSPSVVGSCTASSVPVSPGWNGNWWANEPNGWSQYPATTTEYRLNCVGTNGSLSNTAKAVVSVTAPSAVPITIYVSTSCTIPVGGSTCTVTAATMGHENTKIYDLFNKTRGITTGSAFSLSNRFTFTPTYGDTAAHIIYGANALAVRSWGSTTDLATVTVNGVCASGSTWNGSVCATVVSSAQKATMLGEAVSNANNMVASGVRNVISTLSGANQVFAGSCIDLQSNLHRGNETTAVNKLQDFLSSKGFLSGSSTGFFGDLTIEAVKAYQRSLGLPETGMVYDFTRRAIKAETCN